MKTKWSHNWDVQIVFNEEDVLSNEKWRNNQTSEEDVLSNEKWGNCQSKQDDDSNSTDAWKQLHSWAGDQRTQQTNS